MARVLIVDDEEGIRLSLKRALEMEGYEVELAQDGEQAESLFRENPADLLITDIVMPKKEGIEIIMALKRDFPKLKVIVISGGTKVAEADDVDFLLSVAKNVGADLSFSKPFDLPEMMVSINDILNGNS